VNNDATFETRKLDFMCGEPGCLQKPTRIGVGVLWVKRKLAIYAWCNEHAAAAMARARNEKAAEEGLQ